MLLALFKRLDKANKNLECISLTDAICSVHLLRLVGETRLFVNCLVNKFSRYSLMVQFIHQKFINRKIGKLRMGIRKIAVVGAGVIGLSTALQVQRSIDKVSVTVFADNFSPDTTGDVSAGLWMPYLLQDTPQDLVT